MAGVSGSMRTVFVFKGKAYNLTKAQFSGALHALALDQANKLDPVKEEWKELGAPVFADQVGTKEALEYLTALASGKE
jgi:hypothetical protein